MEKLNVEQMEKVAGGKDVGCYLAIASSVGCIAAAAASAPTGVGAFAFIGLWWLSIAEIGIACYG